MRKIPELSFNLTIFEIDEIVDELRKGKYSKKHPSFSDLIRTGLFKTDLRNDYLEQRWKHELTPAGLTMRKNKLRKLFSSVVGNLNSKLNPVFKMPNSIWKCERFSNYRSDRDWSAPPMYILGEFSQVKDIYEIMLKPFVSNDEASENSQDIHFFCLGDKNRLDYLNQDFNYKIDQTIQEIEKTMKAWERQKIELDSLKLALEHATMIT